MTLSIIDTIEGWIKPFKDFIYKNHSNPLLWLIIILIVLAVFFLTYEALHKDN